MIASSALLSLVVCSLWCLALVEAVHYKFIWKAQDPIFSRTFTEFVVTFKGEASGFHGKTFPASKGDDNGVFEIPESEFPEGASIFNINAHYTDNNFISAFHNELIGNKPNEEGITVIELFYDILIAHQQKVSPPPAASLQGFPASMGRVILVPK